MPTVTLSQKAHDNSQLTVIEKLLISMLKNLKVHSKVVGRASRNWVQVSVSGEDEKVAINYLAKEIGLCQTLLTDVKKFSILKGYIRSIDKRGIWVDVGPFSPDTIKTMISLRALQAELADGKKAALHKLVELFGFCDDLPLTIKIYDLAGESERVEAVLSGKQLTLYRSWMESLLDRLIVLGVSLDELRLALKTAKCDRDVIDIESLGLFEYAVVCKLGTDAVGLIPRIGKKLWGANFSVFNSREILKFLSDV